jgi:branched-chain amino acid transport system ATP-binding protein
VLEIHDLHVSYGPVPAVRGVNIQVREGEAVAMLGRNGAGKTTTLRAIAGLNQPSSGSVVLAGRDITRRSSVKRVGLGISLAPEGRGMFPQFTVRDSLAMGAYHRRLSRSEVHDEIERVTDRFPRLRERLGQVSGSLSGGEQQMLALARALMGRPRLLMLDEPSLGLAPVLVDQLYELLRSLRTDGLTILVVEQYVEVALSFADRAYVLDKGIVALEGPSAELAASPALVDTYLAATPQEVAS